MSHDVRIILPPEGGERISTLDADSASAALAAPFDAADIEWRIARSGITNGKPWGKCLAYITNRAIMDRLDGVVGAQNWKNEYSRWGDKGVLCGLAVKLNGEWVTKYDGAEETDIESVKGGLSSAMKRAAVQWGIGRYLYGLEEGFAQFGEKGVYSAKIDGTFYKWSPPALPRWALPAASVTGTRAKDPTPLAVRESLAAMPAALLEPEQALPEDGPVWPLGKEPPDGQRGIALKAMTTENLNAGRIWCVKGNGKGKFTELIGHIDAELKRRTS